MAGNAKKTEHAGAKHGNGAYWGRKVDAKRESNKVRRRWRIEYDGQDITDRVRWTEMSGSRPLVPLE